jgi:DUF1680 family protein
LEEIPQYVWYAEEENAVLTLAQHFSSTLESDFVKANVCANLPYDGKVCITLDSFGKPLTLRVRKPEWCDVTFPNEQDGYLIYQGAFNGEEIVIDFKPTLKQVYANPLAPELSGKTALTYGPIVLCAEGADNDFNLFAVGIGDIAKATVTPLPDSPYALRVTLPVVYEQPMDTLYTYQKSAPCEKILTMIPYFAWANREENDMRVWFPITK